MSLPAWPVANGVSIYSAASFETKREDYAKVDNEEVEAHLPTASAAPPITIAPINVHVLYRMPWIA
jgi:hypothetical protein